MKIDRITIAVTHMKEFVEFYNAVFDSEFTPIAGLEGFYSGKMGGFDVLLCPNEIAGVVAEQNRHQLRFVVDDLDEIMTKGRAAGGQPIEDAQANAISKSQSIRDPDGNSMEFIQLCVEKTDHSDHSKSEYNRGNGLKDVMYEPTND